MMISRLEAATGLLHALSGLLDQRPGETVAIVALIAMVAVVRMLR